MPAAKRRWHGGDIMPAIVDDIKNGDLQIAARTT
jgi:hypothetical protein